MPGKHRCSCFSSGSTSFLYDLRRETPSTDRVLKERLLNVLSRAAANKSKNPQRLWAERPPWWTEVTDLKWKNPREHPKDNKEMLNQKIEILERQLKQRGLMTKEVEDELKAHKEGKKFDLELKSDFEAVIAKASGLHYMVNKVTEKMGSSRVIGDRLASYIRSIKACMKKCQRSVDRMHEQVEEREHQRSLLWKKMGVSKEGAGDEAIKRRWSEVDVDLESHNLMMDINEDLLSVSQDSDLFVSPTSSPSSPEPPFLPLSPHYFSASQQGLVAKHTLPFLPSVRRRMFETPATKSSQSESDSTRLRIEITPVLSTRESSAKKSRTQSTDDAEDTEVPVTVKQSVCCVSPPTSKPVRLVQTLKKSLEQKRHTPKGRFHEHSTRTETSGPGTGPWIPSSTGLKAEDLEEDGSVVTTNLPFPRVMQDVYPHIFDVPALSGSTEQLDLEGVENIIEYGQAIPVSVETFEESDVKAMNSLAEQAKALSFDDLRPSVMEDFNVQFVPGLSFQRSVSDTMTMHSFPSVVHIPSHLSFLEPLSVAAPATSTAAATATKKEKQAGSLSKAIANFLN